MSSKSFNTCLPTKNGDNDIFLIQSWCDRYFKATNHTNDHLIKDLRLVIILIQHGFFSQDPQLSFI